ncbi:hypothetical protein Mgra_00004802 [Meloidogyne graminicola]|uniref:Histone-lysine N-methyltransferase n=1 Tax=Meloidogyne graminicola TaxID=189291 RepID=A0A8S9ZRE1_9BILA|nr:hypothetical protein Mgra_00004802 [Meloidogyne graminicola]
MDFEYITENISLDPSVLDDDYFEGCSCIGECASNCTCLFDGKPNYDNSGRFLYSPNSSSTSVHMECSNNCECVLCPEKCTNRNIQNGIKFKLKVAKCDLEEKGFGVFAEELIPCGHFVVEYVGELLSRDEAEKRLKLINHQKHNYLFTIREYIGGDCRFTFIDGLYKGNISRFINHRRVSPSLAMFASRDIQKGEELSYSYGFISNNNKEEQSNDNSILSIKKCLCNSSKCKGRLPSVSTI